MVRPMLVPGYMRSIIQSEQRDVFHRLISGYLKELFLACFRLHGA